MKISLPKNYSFKDLAIVKNGVLYIYKNFNFKDLMYDLTYNVKDNTKCYYCGTPLERCKSSLDHMYPRDSGGPTFPENLCISCTKCNNEKSNMTADEYFYYLSLPPEKRKEYFNSVRMCKSTMSKWYAPSIPKEWMTEISTFEVDVPNFIEANTQGKSYKRIENFYKKTGRFTKPVIIDRNLRLLDGFNVVLFARNNSIATIPAIILDNVEVTEDKLNTLSV